jgi:hypothetical protein
VRAHGRLRIVPQEYRRACRRLSPICPSRRAGRAHREPDRLRGVVARRAQGLERSAGAPGAALCLPFAGGERSVADLARYFQIDGLGARLNFDNLVKRLAV